MLVGSKHTKETKLKMSNSRMGFAISEETKRKLSESHKGKKFSKEHKKNLSKSHLGLIHSGTFKKGHKDLVSKEARIKIGEAHKKSGLKPPPMKDWLTKEIRIKMSESRKGEKCHLWRGGITPINAKIRTSLEYRMWRESVFKRDNFTCVWCGERGGDLNADHIKPFAYFPELRFELSNGRTLCVPCHRKTDTYGGKLKRNEAIVIN